MSELRTDSDISHDVAAELRWSPGIDERHIAIDVTDGFVTLSGFVSTFEERRGAERAVRRVAGVRALTMALAVRSDDDELRPRPAAAARSN